MSERGVEEEKSGVVTSAMAVLETAVAARAVVTSYLALSSISKPRWSIEMVEKAVCAESGQPNIPI